MSSRFALVKDKLQGDIKSVIADVFGSINANPRRRKRLRWALINPWAGSKSANLHVYLTGARAGGWKDFTTGETGDIIDLVAFGKEGSVNPDSRMRVIEWAEDRYGIRKLDAATRAKMDKEAADRRDLAEKAAVESQAEQRDRVRKTFYACQAKILGTPVETYLATRGVVLADVPHITPAFRYRPDCEYWPLAPVDGEGQRLGRGPLFPAMVSAMVSGDGRLGALHLTFFDHDGLRKAPVQTLAAAQGLDPRDFSAKLFKGDVQGFVIRCTNGPSGLSAERAAEAGVAGICGITEGIEDALSAAVAHPALRMWAAGSLSGLLHVHDHPAVSAWIIFKDNDWGKPQAAALFDRAVARLRSFKKPVEVLAMPADWGKDVNDALNQED
ncbi:toprim domain-containing protein [Mesorhizobium sp. CA13]|uniref:DUF7146 domain-containing protein n=1 Tax=Mesorhizobium sp. CA13 TaxID=2876643 RepID=UPI001CCAF761|nr:toprim domain-containing protein [Mesorhizobium sp. CA13]MBZ9856744.1 toprim domain-containing protein [Mesorhizobium sp. CA13]